jgi:hypothetical protein
MEMSNEVYEKSRIKERAALYRQQSPLFSQWAAGYGVIKHEDSTQVRVYEMADLLNVRDIVKSPDEVFQYLAAADRIAIARKIIILDVKTMPSLTLIAIGFIIIALAIGYYLIKRSRIEETGTLSSGAIDNKSQSTAD